MTRRVAAEAIADAGIEGAELDGDRDHQPARDRRRLGPGQRRAAPPGARLAGPPHRRALRGAARGRPRGRWSASAPASSSTPTSPATKIEWLLRNVEGAERAVFGTIDSWLALQADRPPRHRLHQRLADDALRHPPARLGRGALRAARRRPGAAARAAALGRASSARPPSSAARCRSPGSPATSRRRSSARPAIAPGMAKNTYGTGSFVLLNTGAEAPEPADGPADHGRLRDRRARPPTRSRPRSSSPAPRCSGCATGSGSIDEAAETEALAASLEGNDGVYFVPALTGLGSPHWDPYARGTIVGLTRGSGRAHLARAALEAIAYQTVDAVRAQEAAARRAAGGAQGRRRRGRQPLADAVPGRRARRRRWSCPRSPRRPRSAPPTWPGSRPAPGAAEQVGGDVARGGPLRAADGRGRARARCSPTGAGRSSARAAGPRPSGQPGVTGAAAGGRQRRPALPASRPWPT